jgi:thioredoxin-related protein
MHKIKLVVLALVTIMATSMKSSEEIKWMDFNQGYELAKKKNKIMLVDVYTEWCGWCKRMDKDAYAKPEIAELVGKDFIAIKFNPEVEGVTYNFEGKSYTGPQLAQVISNNQINVYPTTIFMNPKAKTSEIMVGYKNAEQLKPILVDIVGKLKSKK